MARTMMTNMPRSSAPQTLRFDLAALSGTKVEVPPRKATERETQRATTSVYPSARWSGRRPAA